MVDMSSMIEKDSMRAILKEDDVGTISIGYKLVPFERGPHKHSPDDLSGAQDNCYRGGEAVRVIYLIYHFESNPVTVGWEDGNRKVGDLS